MTDVSSRPDAVRRLQERVDALWAVNATHAELRSGRPVLARRFGTPLPPDPSDTMAVEDISVLQSELGLAPFRQVPFDFAGRWRALILAIPASSTGVPGGGIARAAGGMSLQVRLLPHTPLSADDLHLPEVLTRDAGANAHGLIAVCGRRMSGRTTTAASLFIAAARARGSAGASALTIEDPVEYVFTEGSLGGSAAGHTSVAQLDAHERWEECTDLAVHGSFDQVFFSSFTPQAGGRQTNLGLAAAEVAATGKLVIGTVHGSSFAEAFFQLAGVRWLGGEDVDLSAARAVAQQLRAIVLQELIHARGPGNAPFHYPHLTVAYLTDEDRWKLLELLTGRTSPEAILRNLQQFFRTNVTAAQSLKASLDRLPTHVRLLASIL